jgi:hypothetical protein
LKEKEKQNEKESHKPGKNRCAMEKPGVKGKYNKTSHQKKKATARKAHTLQLAKSVCSMHRSNNEVSEI